MEEGLKEMGVRVMGGSRMEMEWGMRVVGWESR